MESFAWIITTISIYLGVSQGRFVTLYTMNFYILLFLQHVAQLLVQGPAVSAPGESIRLFCLLNNVPVTDNIQWFVNDTLHMDTPVLVITNLTLEYNMTCIKCKMNTMMSDCHILQLQGRLSE